MQTLKSQLYSEQEMLAFESEIESVLNTQDADKDDVAALEELILMKQTAPVSYMTLLETTMLGTSCALVAMPDQKYENVAKGCLTPSRELLKKLLARVIQRSSVTSMLPDVNPAHALKASQQFAELVPVAA